MAMSRAPFWGASQLSVVGPVGWGEAGSGDGKGLKVRLVGARCANRNMCWNSTKRIHYVLPWVGEWVRGEG